jgi:hypothetical protein
LRCLLNLPRNPLLQVSSESRSPWLLREVVELIARVVFLPKNLVWFFNGSEHMGLESQLMLIPAGAPNFESGEAGVKLPALSVN